jgi:hypothetical protein
VAINERRAKFRQDLITGGYLEKQDDCLGGPHPYGTGLPSLHNRCTPGILSEGSIDNGKARHRHLPVINLRPGGEGEQNFRDTQDVGNAEVQSELVAPVLPGSTEDLAEPAMTRSTEELYQHQKQDLNTPALGTGLRWENMAEPMVTNSWDGGA